MTRLGPSSLLSTAPAYLCLCLSLPGCGALNAPAKFFYGVPYKCGERPSSDLSGWVRQVDGTFTLSTAL